MWGGRFESETDKLAAGFHSSISFDKRLYRVDITGSIAHAKMLGATGIIPQADSEAIVGGLESILKDIENGKIAFCESDEDIHMNIERLLTERIGEGRKTAAHGTQPKRSGRARCAHVLKAGMRYDNRTDKSADVNTLRDSGAAS